MPALDPPCANHSANHSANPRRLRVVDILRAHAAEYLTQRGTTAGLHQRSTLAQLTACRTARLGGHAWRCDQCGTQRVDYHSCRNRFCPGCGGAKRARWLTHVAASLLPVPHFQLVFTLPHELSALILGNRRELYDLLFRAAWETLRDVAFDPQHLGADVGALLVLHTWGQTLEHHPHVHAVVPGGGLSLDGQRWVASRSPQFLLPVIVLSRVFRGKFLAGLIALRAAGKLRLALSPPTQLRSHANAATNANAQAKMNAKMKMNAKTLADDATWHAWFASLAAREWVVFSQAPPPEIAANDPAPLLKYLARYVSGAAISDARLLAHERGLVTFRGKNYRAGRKRMTLTLSGIEFTRRFALHILPSGFARVRRYGLLAPRSRASQRCREIFSTATAAEAATARAPATPSLPELPASNAAADCAVAAAADTTRRCPHCDIGQLYCSAARPRPNLWVVLLRSGLSRSWTTQRPSIDTS